MLAETWWQRYERLLSELLGHAMDGECECDDSEQCDDCVGGILLRKRLDEHVRAAHQERDADARRLDAIQRALTDLDLYADGIAIAAYIVSATGELGYSIGHLDGDTAHFGDDADGPTLRAAIDEMAADTQTEGESDGE